MKQLLRLVCSEQVKNFTKDLASFAILVFCMSTLLFLYIIADSKLYNTILVPTMATVLLMIWFGVKLDHK